MPSFDVSSELDWPNLDNAVQHCLKEITTRFDFKNIKVELTVDKKEKFINMWCSEPTKLQAMRESFETKLTKRGLSLLSFEFKEVENAFGGSVRQKILVQAGIEKEKGKEIVQCLKDSKLKVQAQIQDEKVRVSSKNRDDLQAAIAYLKEQQSKIKVPMNYGNFRE
jgi:uncharacterized protein YajQ (UPF0234 family)